MYETISILLKPTEGCKGKNKYTVLSFGFEKYR